ncbi:MAG: GNAT family N-acetyltransferase [Nitrososphaerales archaeon]
MESNNYHLLEQNEEEWFSLWCDRIFIDGNLILFNESFKEDPLFNRIYLRKKGVDAQRLANFFEERGISGYFFLPPDKEEGLEEELKAQGLIKVDELRSMKLKSFLGKTKSEFKIVKTDLSNLEDWIKVYYLSFDIPDSWLPEIRRRLRILIENPKVELLLAYGYKGVYGAMALYFTERIIGIYCLGTLKRFRRIGVSSSLINYAYEKSIGKILCLQTLVSEGNESFYIKRGFETLYSKPIYSLKRTKLSQASRS